MGTITGASFLTGLFPCNWLMKEKKKKSCTSTQKEERVKKENKKKGTSLAK